jgi:polyhydroxyalkanoate synthesis repressor PhaR
MPVIKRYPNRKLYDTDAKQYITLDGIADLIRKGEDVRVVDHATGEDLTAVTLAQIILEEQKKQSGFLPRSFLSGLIQASGDRLNSLQRSLTFPLTFWHQFDEEVRRRIQMLINQGQLSEGEGRNMLEKILAQSFRPQDEQQITEQTLQQALTDRQVPNKQDIQRLSELLDNLNARLESIEKGEK